MKNKIKLTETEFTKILKRIINEIERKEEQINQFDDNGEKQGYWDYIGDKKYGSKHIKGNYENGLKYGYFEIYDSKGRLLTKGDFKDDKQISGVSFSYESIKSKNPKRKYTFNSNGYYYEEYTRDGRLKLSGNVKNSKKVGEWKTYSMRDGSVLQIITYDNGRMVDKKVMNPRETPFR